MTEKNSPKKEGVPCRILAGILGVLFFLGGFALLVGGLHMDSLGWKMFALFDGPINLYIGFECASVAIRGKTVFIFKSKQAYDTSASDEAKQPKEQQ